MYVKNVKDILFALGSGKTFLEKALFKEMKSGIAAVLILAISFFVLMSIVNSASASTWCDSCSGCAAYEVKVDDIIFERLDGGDPAEFCEDDRIRVSAIVAVDEIWDCWDCGYCGDPEVRAELYVDGEYYGSALTEVPSSIYRRVEFDRIIYTKDFPISSSVEVKVVAKTLCAEDEHVEYFYVKDCEEECDWCDWCDVDWECWRYDYCECGTRDYGTLKVKVKDCAENEPLIYARVRVEGINDYTKITHYNGYVIFTLYQGEYTVTAWHEDYGEREQKVYVRGGTTKDISVCLPGDCNEGYSGEFRCFGDYVQRQYVESDCTKRWRIVEECPYGCAGGSCVPPTGQTKQTQSTNPTDVAAAIVSLKERYKAEKCKVGNFSFDVINIGSVEATFDLAVTGSAADSVYIPSSITLQPRERKSLLAYAYSCDAGSHQFTITASTTLAGEVVTTSSESVLKIVEAGFVLPEDSLFKTGWTTFILICVVVAVVLVVWRIKLGIGFKWPRKQRPEDFESFE